MSQCFISQNRHPEGHLLTCAYFQTLSIPFRLFGLRMIICRFLLLPLSLKIPRAQEFSRITSGLSVLALSSTPGLVYLDFEVMPC